MGKLLITTPHATTVSDTASQFSKLPPLTNLVQYSQKYGRTAQDKHAHPNQRLQFCHDDTCQITEHLHLKIETEDVELSRSLAIAISYTWGEFDRKDVVIGHSAQGNIVRMNLGKEWDIKELIVSLAMICIENGEEHGMEHAACWIDQLCIIQTQDDDIRTTLAKIPSIYRTLDVVALMPGSLCSCLQQQADWLYSEKELTPFSHRWGDMLTGCVHCLGLCSYFDRVWTRQELLYSQSIRIVRTSFDETPCVKSVDDVHNLSSFTNRLFIRYLQEGLTREQALLRIQSENLLFSGESYSSIQLYRGSSHDGRASRIQQVGFLLGQRLLRQEQETRQQDGKSRLHEFLYRLESMGRSNRRATKARDYVTSVWVDCPGYILPKDFKKMCLPSLLEDAVRQLENNHGVSIPVIRSTGILGNNLNESLLWRPMKYLGRQRIFGADQIYNVLIPGLQSIPITKKGEVPLCVLAPPIVALSRLAGEYSKVFSGQNSADVYEALKRVINNWPDPYITRALVWHGKFVMHSGRVIDRSIKFILFLLSYANRERGIEREGFGNMNVSSWDRSIEVDHYQLVYRLVTVVLGLDSQECQRRGLRLMVSLNYPICIGLTTMELGDGKARMSAKSWTQQDIGDVVTICAENPQKSRSATKEYGTLLLEGVKKEGSPTARYHINGVWVPFGFISSFKPGAFVEAGGQDGLLY